MATTHTPGITVDSAGRFLIDKRHRGFRIGMRVGSITQEHAEQRLSREIRRVDQNLAYRDLRQATFADCPEHYQRSRKTCPAWRQ